jgi:5'-AMP-activated protein kinase catalytic alpha subunit
MGGLSEGDRLGHYILGRTIGEGSFGKVKLARHELTGHKVAVKILSKEAIESQGMAKKVRREIKILRLFEHPHVIRLYEVVQTETHIYMVMEYAEGGVLLDFILRRGKLPEAETRYFYQQIVSALEYCHENMVVHRSVCHRVPCSSLAFGICAFFRLHQPTLDFSLCIVLFQIATEI